MATGMQQPMRRELTPEERRKLTREEWLEILPLEKDLPSEVWPMESSIQALQLRLLVTILEWYWRDRNDFFIGDNLTIYFSYELNFCKKRAERANYGHSR